MQKKPINILSFNSCFFPFSNHNHPSKKINNKFKKSSTTQYSTKNTKKQINPQSHSQNIPENPIGINSINNNIYLNLFNKFNSNTTSLKQNVISPKEIISNRINNNQINKIRKNLNLYEMPSSSSIKTKNKSTYIQPDLIDSMNFINNQGHINIRLNLKNQFINFNNNNINNLSDYNIKSGLDITEKMKEKNDKILQLQNDLLKSQEIIYDLNIINGNFKSNQSNKNRINNNLNKSSRGKNIFKLTKNSESVNKILKTAFNIYNINDNNSNKKRSDKKNHKNNFLKKSGNINNIKRMNNNEKKRSNKNNIKINDILYTNYNQNNIKKQKDYLKLFLPMSNFYNKKLKFSSYSNDRKKVKNKINFNLDFYLNNTTDKNKKQKIYINNYITNNKKNIVNNIDEFIKNCENIKQRAKNLIYNYIDLADCLVKNKIKS